LRANGSFEGSYVGVSGGWPGSVNGISAFDAFLDVDRTWFAMIEQGQVTLRIDIGSGGVTRLLGPHGPSQLYSLNADPMCTASQPVVVRQFEHVAIAWTERCGTGPYKAYLRYVR
jgi:hypothetical protein